MREAVADVGVVPFGTVAEGVCGGVPAQALLEVLSEVVAMVMVVVVMRRGDLGKNRQGDGSGCDELGHGLVLMYFLFGLGRANKK
jgi:hypothetical protein